MLKFRLISFTGLLALMALMGYWGWDGACPPKLYFVFMALALAATVLMALEVYRLLAKIGLPSLPAAGAFYLAIPFLLDMLRAVGELYAPGYASVPPPVVFGIDLLEIIYRYAAPVVAWGLILCDRDRVGMVKKVAVTAGVALLLGWIVRPMVNIFLFQGMWIFLFFVLTTKAGDTGGYIAGKLTSYLPGGNHKIAPSISPAKSWEGLFGGLVLSVAAALIFHWTGAVDISWWGAAAFGVVLYFGGFAGDLTESAFKRACGVKDSGVIMPGMGGVFDVIDSFIYNAPMFAFLWMYYQSIEHYLTK